MDFGVSEIIMSNFTSLKRLGFYLLLRARARSLRDTRAEVRRAHLLSRRAHCRLPVFGEPWHAGTYTVAPVYSESRTWSESLPC